MGVESNEKQNLENLSKSIIEFASGIQAETSFASLQIALEYVFQLAEKERIILTIDEYPYVARASKSLASTLQLLIDKYKDSSKLMLILCGSPMSYMEDHVLAYKAPLYGRRTAQMKILPFNFEESCQYFQNLPPEDKALMYGIIGGTPQYLLQMSDKLSVEENIKNNYLNPMAFLYEEPLNLLKQEVREPGIYNAIITAIATGHSRMSEICIQYLWKQLHLGNVQIEFTSLGRWWGNIPKTKSQVEIDIMGEQNDDCALFAECKRRNENIDLDVLEALIERSELFHYKTVQYYLFSKTGFTKGCIEKANKMENVTLISYMDIVNASV